MIRKVVLRRFKGFNEVAFDLPGNVVLAGPNNSGKTTLLQAIAVWELALRRWRELYEPKKQNGNYVKAPVARQAFLSVPLRSFDLLWNERVCREPIEIEVTGDAGWSLCMQLLWDTSEQVFVRPWSSTPAEVIARASVTTAFVPAMSSVAFEEPFYGSPATIDALLGRVRAGDVLRNLLFHASQQEDVWRAIQTSVRELFGYELLVPNASIAFIQADYRTKEGGPVYDLMSAGSGFQQVLLLLCFLHTRPGSVLLLDEPDAHLHVVLQDAIYGELKRVAAQKNSQLVIATHSEVIVNAAQIDEIRVAFDPGQALADPHGKAKENVKRALRWISNVEIAQAQRAPGILYLEDYTDLEILRAWARVLRHPAHALLTTELFRQKTVVDSPSGHEGLQAKDHYEALRIVREIPGLILVDGDARPEIGDTPITGTGLQRSRWHRYEVESYLVHPEALARFCAHVAGGDVAGALNAKKVLEHFNETYPPAFLREPLGDYPLLNRSKARTELIPPALTAGGLPAFPYQRYHEIAAVMAPAEIHPEVIEKLDTICKAFGRKPR